MTTFAPLTPRQLEVAVLYADTDLSPRQVGARLGITKTAVKDHAYAVYQALRVHSRPHLRSVLLECELAPGGVR